MAISRGRFYLADLNPRRATEPGKTRPVLVIQTDLLTVAGHPSTIVLPLTTQVQAEAAPLRVRVPSGRPGFDVDSDVMTDQVRAIDNRRFYRGDTDELIKDIGPAEASVLTNVERCLALVLDLPGTVQG
jgi:mRNA interferase MazF